MELDFTPLDEALEEALSLGAQDAEAYLEREDGLSVECFDLHLEKFKHSQSAGVGIRVFPGGRYGRSYTSDPSRESVRGVVRQAVEAAAVSPGDPHRRLPEPEALPDGAGEGLALGEDMGTWEGDLAMVSPSQKIEFAIGLESLAREYDPRVTGVETAVYGEGSSEVRIASTKGMRSGYRSSICYGYLVAMAEQDGESQSGFGFTAGRSFGSLDMKSAAEEAASQAVRLLGGRQVESAQVPVLFDNLSSAEILSFVGDALSAETVVKGRSFLAGRLGKRVAAECLTVVDDGLLFGGFGTAPFDAEGVATARKTAVEAGVLYSYLHNTYTASRMDAGTTGNAGRDSYRGRVGVSHTNLFIEPGEASPDELRSGMGRGLEVLGLKGVNVGLNPVTGEVSVGATGLWIEDGRPAFPVREVTIAGTLTGVLEGIVGVGNDMRFTPLLGGIGTPSVLVEGLVVSGK